MNVKYPTLVGEIAKRGLKKKEIAAKAGMTERAFRNKLVGRTAFTWPEVGIIQSNFFPDIDLGELFCSADDHQQYSA